MIVKEMIEALKLMPPDAEVMQYNGEYMCWDNISKPILYTREEADNAFFSGLSYIPEGTTHIVSI